MKLEPVGLENRIVRLEPLGETHREGLRAATAADPDIWTRLYPYSWLGKAFEPTWARVQGDMTAGRWVAFAVVAEGRCQGTTNFLAIDRGNATVEIGGTYYAPALRGGAVNPAAKRLMLAYAFETAGARRVSFRVDAINARSRAAVLKLGAVQEGILRQARHLDRPPARHGDLFDSG